MLVTAALADITDADIGEPCFARVGHRVSASQDGNGPASPVGFVDGDDPFLTAPG